MDNAGGRDLDVITGQLVARLLERAHLVAPDEIADSVAEAAGPLGVTGARIYLADLEQRKLRPVAGSGAPRALTIDATLAGRAYRTVSMYYGPADGGSGWRVWVPLIGGTERLGKTGQRGLDEPRFKGDPCGLAIGVELLDHPQRFERRCDAPGRNKYQDDV